MKTFKQFIEETCVKESSKPSNANKLKDELERRAEILKRGPRGGRAQKAMPDLKKTADKKACRGKFDSRKFDSRMFENFTSKRGN